MTAGCSRSPERGGARDFLADVLLAGGCAAVLGGLPSTVHALSTGGAVLEPTRAAGSMLLPAATCDRRLLPAAALVHAAVTLFWATVLTAALPRRRTLAWAIAASVPIAVLDLRIIGRAFPRVHALPFGPQLADHLAWGASLGAVLQWRWRRHVPRARARYDASA